MNRNSWNRILDKYSKAFGPGKKVRIVYKTAQSTLTGTITEVDDDFLVVGTERGPAIVVLEAVAAILTI
jgi:hypothetical protein